MRFSKEVAPPSYVCSPPWITSEHREMFLQDLDFLDCVASPGTHSKSRALALPIGGLLISKETKRNYSAPFKFMLFSSFFGCRVVHSVRPIRDRYWTTGTEPSFTANHFYWQPVSLATVSLAHSSLNALSHFVHINQSLVFIADPARVTEGEACIALC
eukprot:1914247-Pyramimonas_sp.AAC.2